MFVVCGVIAARAVICRCRFFHIYCVSLEFGAFGVFGVWVVFVVCVVSVVIVCVVSCLYVLCVLCVVCRCRMRGNCCMCCIRVFL